MEKYDVIGPPRKIFALFLGALGDVNIILFTDNYTDYRVLLYKLQCFIELSATDKNLTCEIIYGNVTIIADSALCFKAILGVIVLYNKHNNTWMLTYPGQHSK